MASATFHIDLDALADNWRALDRLSGKRAAAVVKADGYGLDAATVTRTLARAGARAFFVAVAEEGAAVRAALGPGPMIGVFGGHVAGDAALLRDHALTPMLNSPEQFQRHRGALAEHPFGIQLDTGMNRLGMEPADWAGLRTEALEAGPVLLMSHLACADETEHPQNRAQLAAFREMTEDAGVARSLSATGGILLGPDYHFDMTRPGIGIYGGAPFTEARPVVRLSVPVIQCRDVAEGEIVGYGASWIARRPSRIATISCGYADGVLRSLSNSCVLYAGDIACPLTGRVSMDLITVDVTDLPEDPETLDLIGPHQGVDALADQAGTIGYEILTSLGRRYHRDYSETAAESAA